MPSNPRSAFAVVERVARVREVQAKRRLVEAHAREREQQAQVDQAQFLLRRAERALSSLIAKRQVDVACLELYAELTREADHCVAEAAEALSARSEERVECAGDCRRSVKYREQAQLRRDIELEERQRAREEYNRQECLEVWLLGTRGRDQ